MNERRTETVSIGNGVSYAKVAARSAEFHKDNEKCAIETTCEFRDGYVLFSAKVTTSKGVFTGHSMDKVTNRQKQFEKQETIAVGRALAFAGYLASGDIACAEEMADMVTVAQLNALKMRYHRANKDVLTGKDQPAIRQAFVKWCRGIIEEDIDYNDPRSWCREWLDACWQELIGVAEGVPFEGAES